MNRPAPTIVDNIETSGFETHLLECYLFVDDYLQSNSKVAGWLRSMGGDPDFTDAEVIAGALSGRYFRTDTLKRTYQLVIANAEGAFPDRAGYKQWIRRLQRLPDQVGRLVRAAALRGLSDESRMLYAADSLPIPLCEPARHGRVRLLAEDGGKFGACGFRPLVLRVQDPRAYPWADPDGARCDAPSE